jgi:hypothetical protein
VQSAVTTATITGSFDFTTPQGVTYHVLNATITEPGYGPNGSGGASTDEPGFQPIAAGKRPGTVLRKRHARPKRKAKTTSKHGVRCSSQHALTFTGAGGSRRCAPRRTKAPAGTSSRCLRYGHGSGRVPTCTHWLTSDGDGVVPIDAATNPTAAAAAMVQFSTATGKTFTPTDNPLYSKTDQSIISGYWQTPSDQHNSSSGTITIDHQEASSWSVGGSVGAGVWHQRARVRQRLGQRHVHRQSRVVDSHDDSQAVTANVDPGYIAWIEGYTRSPGQVTLKEFGRPPARAPEAGDPLDLTN